MIESEFTVEPATWSVDVEDLRSVRTQVFVVEQEVPEKEEWDALDAESRHVIARDAERRPIGTGRLTPHGKIGRMAVLQEWRGRGVGEAVLRVLMEQARALHFKQVEIHAQTHAMAFYARAGFAAYGEEFDECGIMHRHMRKDLAPIEQPDRALPSANESNLLESSDRESARAAMLAVLESGRREICIFTRDLDPDLLDHSDILEALKQVAIAGPHVQIRILVMESERARVETPRLIALAQRLSSVISFRTPIEDIDRRYAGSFIVSDRSAWFERPLATRFEGEGSTHAPGRTAQFLETFNTIWERSENCAEMRRLEI